MEPTGRSSTVSGQRERGLGVRAAGERDEPARIVDSVGMGKPIPQLQPHPAVVGLRGQLGGVRVAE